MINCINLFNGELSYSSFGGSEIARQYKVNEQIRSAQVRVIGENGEQLGVMSLDQGLQLARESDVDLVEVSPNAP